MSCEGLKDGVGRWLNQPHPVPLELLVLFSFQLILFLGLSFGHLAFQNERMG